MKKKRSPENLTSRPVEAITHPLLHNEGNGTLGGSYIREQVEKLNSIYVPKSACTWPTYGTREHAYLPRASRMQRTQGV